MYGPRYCKKCFRAIYFISNSGNVLFDGKCDIAYRITFWFDLNGTFFIVI